ncbi:odorant receptor 2a-like [Microplitis mediator]|uniref:odorant receptor 2a-like n=1 Tax=Microplitis mediator TaxID=375433 RepID=UPI002552DFEA|nr:odorant receptor 2a-like [Microplitis mediator]
MEILTTNFFVLSLVGLWKPRGWSGIKAILYHFYSAIVIFANISFLISGIMDLEFTNIDIAAFIDNISLLLSLVTIRQKTACAIGNRGDIKEIIDSLGRSPFKPQDEEEVNIVKRFDDLTGYILKYYPVLFTVAITWYSMGHMFIMDPPYVLPYRGWFPYNYTTTSIYWLTAVYQLYAICSAASINLAFDPLLPCIICHMCAQVHILRYRFGVMLKKLEVISDNEPRSVIASAERKLMGEWVDYHISILNLIKYVNSTYSKVIFVQYTASSLILCTVAYVLSHMDALSMNFAGNFFYFIAMNFQIFFQCFCANQVTLEFLDITTALYDTNWFNLSNNVRRSMTIILCESFRPVLFTSSFFIVLSLESFTKVIKCAYTVYNVLQ